MMGVLAPPASGVPAAIAEEAGKACFHQEGGSLRSWLHCLWKRREVFGITRIGSLTRLDRVGVPIVQVTRPLALSNAVSQGKGTDEASAAASGIMEAVETWAAERVPASAVRESTALNLGQEVIDLYAPWARPAPFMDWTSRTLPWMEGYDLLSGSLKPVPLALVDADYSYPSGHMSLFPRVTTGLGAGATMTAAIIQAGLEILERDALTRTYRIPYYFERHQVDIATIGAGLASVLLDRLRRADILVGVWHMPTGCGLPAYRCHLVEDGWPSELAPMPAEGSSCHFTHERALTGALLEACQARLAAISGAREDMTRRMYPPFQEREHLMEWQQRLRSSGCIPYQPMDPHEPSARLDILLDALRKAGAQASVVVPLYSDRDAGVHVVRVVAPPLRLWPRAGHG